MLDDLIFRFFPSSIHLPFLLHPSDKDVIRTDRSLPDFKDGDSCKLHQLEDILKTYVWYNFDLGECCGREKPPHTLCLGITVLQFTNRLNGGMSVFASVLGLFHCSILSTAQTRTV